MDLKPLVGNVQSNLHPGNAGTDHQRFRNYLLQLFVLSRSFKVE
jgi:hypothetical protein